jgi:predicted flavoprotein YhiN
VSISLLREVTGNRIPSDPTMLARLVKAVPVTIESTMPIERAISSAGGISLDEIDASFMLRRLPGTFVAGEMLDWEAPTGGYLLQASFSTAVAAARGAIDWLEQTPTN